MIANPSGDIHKIETGGRRQRPPIVREGNPMKHIHYTTVNIQLASEPKANARKAHCKHCMKMLQPGEGVGYPNEFGYGGGFYYLCHPDSAVYERIKATRAEKEESLTSIAAYLAANLDSKGGVDTDAFLGYISLRNGASLAYGRIRVIVDASGMYRCEVAQAIDQALIEEAPATVDDVTVLAERTAVQMLNKVFTETSELLWVNNRLYKMVMEIQF
jgi:hypothetical protein